MYPILKRILDFISVLLFIVITLPFLIIIPLIVFLQDGHHPIFKQKRVGQFGNIFYFYKFRSMTVDTPDVASTDKSKLKVTPIGKFIRRTNLDEAPQIFNILKGDMTWIGPRPPIPSQKDLIELRKENKSINLKPGVTGWAQVNSYDNMPVEAKAKFDGEYFKKMSLIMDIKIFLKTFIYFFKKPPTY
ncbi:UNVERIFIED_CONTAM: hypothetical protein GTU68_036911 [Idotea baltica]|nr:hypothetical protein [Idotea baltica]